MPKPTPGSSKIFSSAIPAFFAKYKEDGDEEHYDKCFNEEVLGILNAKEVIDELNNLASNMNEDYEHICLLCYEKPEDFCHRHLVSDWLNKQGFKCEEYKWFLFMWKY